MYNWGIIGTGWIAHEMGEESWYLWGCFRAL